MFFPLRKIWLFCVIEIPAIGPKLVLDAVTPEVEVDEEKPLDAIDLVEEQSDLHLLEPLLLP